MKIKWMNMCRKPIVLIRCSVSVVHYCSHRYQQRLWHLIFSLCGEKESNKGREEGGGPRSRPWQRRMLEVRKTTRGTKLFPLGREENRTPERCHGSRRGESLTRAQMLVRGLQLWWFLMPVAVHTGVQLNAQRGSKKQQHPLQTRAHDVHV